MEVPGSSSEACLSHESNPYLFFIVLSLVHFHLLLLHTYGCLSSYLSIYLSFYELWIKTFGYIKILHSLPKHWFRKQRRQYPSLLFVLKEEVEVTYQRSTHACCRSTGQSTSSTSSTTSITHPSLHQSSTLSKVDGANCPSESITTRPWKDSSCQKARTTMGKNRRRRRGMSWK